VSHKLLPHDRLVPAAVLRVVGFGLSHEIVEGGFFDARKEHIADGAVWSLHHCLSDPVQQLHFAGDPLAILEQRLFQVLLCLRLNAPNHLECHPDGIVRHFHGADMDKAGQQLSLSRFLSGMMRL
jgi:hypothetical protein